MLICYDIEYAARKFHFISFILLDKNIYNTFPLVKSDIHVFWADLLVSKFYGIFTS